MVCPSTLLGNWEREAAKHTPGLYVRRFHGAGSGTAVETAEAADVVLTTYGTLLRDEGLRRIRWHRVVLDEAQAMKNGSPAPSVGALACP